MGTTTDTHSFPRSAAANNPFSVSHANKYPCIVLSTNFFQLPRVLPARTRETRQNKYQTRSKKHSVLLNEDQKSLPTRKQFSYRAFSQFYERCFAPLLHCNTSFCQSCSNIIHFYVSKNPLLYLPVGLLERSFIFLHNNLHTLTFEN